jgi:hypothetical protein
MDARLDRKGLPRLGKLLKQQLRRTSLSQSGWNKSINTTQIYIETNDEIKRMRINFIECCLDII